MKIKIICLVLSLVFVAGIFGANSTYAWFVNYALGDGGAQSLHNFSTGDIGYTIVGGFKIMGTDKRIQPEQELLADLTAELKAASGIADNSDAKMYLTSTSLVDTQVRVKVFYTYIDASGIKADGYETVGAGAPFVAEADAAYWVYSEADNYFYYQPSAEGAADYIPAVSESESGHVIPLFTSLRYSGENSDLPTSAFASDNVFNIKVTFQAKQANYAEWIDMGEITFSTGEAA